MALVVRDVRWRDRDEWQRLFVAYLNFYQASVDEAVFEVTFERLLSDEPGTHVGFLAVDEEVGGPVGLTHALFHRSTWVHTGHVYLQDLYVQPDARGRSIGRALIERVYAYARDVGAARTYWLTHEDNAPARVLYDKVAERSGFIQYRHQK